MEVCWPSSRARWLVDGLGSFHHGAYGFNASAPAAYHTLLLVGYDSERGVFIAKNSWGGQNYLRVQTDSASTSGLLTCPTAVIQASGQRCSRRCSHHWRQTAWRGRHVSEPDGTEVSWPVVSGRQHSWPRSQHFAGTPTSMDFVESSLCGANRPPLPSARCTLRVVQQCLFR